MTTATPLQLCFAPLRRLFGSVAPGSPARRARDTAVGLSAAAAAGALAVWRLNAHGLPYSHQVLLAAAVLVGILAPGLLAVSRFSLRSLPAQLGAGFTAGLAFQIASWWAAVRSGATSLVWILPLALSALFCLLLDRLPRRRTAADPWIRTPWWASLLLLSAWLLALKHLDAHLWQATPLNRARPWYQDMDWQLSLSVSGLHSAPILDPQSSAEGVLHYHWFGNAHAAALSLATGVPIDQVGILAWYVPVFAALLAVVYGMAASLSASPAAGAAAALMVPFSPVFLLSKALDTGSTSPLVWQSQSHIFSLPVIVLAAWTAIELLRSPEPDPRQGMLFALLALLSAGAKVSVLPTLLGGCVVVVLTRCRRLRESVRAGVLAALSAGLILATSPFFAGGGGGTAFVFSSTASSLKALRSVLREQAFGPDWVNRTVIVSAALGTLLASALALAALRRLPVSTAPASSITSSARSSGSEVNPVLPSGKTPPIDPAVPFFLGMTAVAAGAHTFLAHPSFSQVYFLRGMAPVTAVFIAWGAVELIRQATDSRLRRSGAAVLTRRCAARWVIALAGAFCLGFWVFLRLRAVSPRIDTSLKAWEVLLAGLIPPALVVLIWLGTRIRSLRATEASALLSLAILGYAWAPSAQAFSGGIRFDPVQQSSTRPAWAIQPDEFHAGKLLARENSARKLIATNVHCQPVKTRSHCEARGFWVSSLTESPVFIGAWAYTDSARRRNGHDGRIYIQQLYENEEDFRLNEAAFQAPTAEVIEQLKQKGVAYLYADRRASPVSPRLRDFAAELWNSKNAAVYRLR